MSSVKPRLVPSSLSARPSGQKSFPKIVDLRVVGGSAIGGVKARARPMAEVTRLDAIDLWIVVINRHCGSREACAAMFGVTFQTACNWFDGVTAPSAAAVMQAFAWWPEAFDTLRDAGRDVGERRAA